MPTLLSFNECGIYCEQADVYIDPWRRVEKALITHGHSDHARFGHKEYLCHPITKPIMQARLGNDLSITTLEHGEAITINGVQFSFHPAGHIPGSVQVRVEYKGEVWVATGDHKRHEDGISAPFEAVPCHTFITECTFGLPAFKWLPQSEVMADINNWWAENKANGQTSLLFGYTLGKAQRLLKHLDPNIGQIFTHGAVENMTEVIRPLVDMPPTTRVTHETKKEDLLGSIVLAPPSAQGTTWLRKMSPFVTGTASGWMAFRGARARRAIDRGFVMSDHCDWQGLLESIKATGAQKIITTHGYSDIFSRYLRELGYDARTANTQYEGELGEVSGEKTTEDNELEDVDSIKSFLKPNKIE